MLTLPDVMRAAVLETFAEYCDAGADRPEGLEERAAAHTLACAFMADRYFNMDSPTVMDDEVDALRCVTNDRQVPVVDTAPRALFDGLLGWAVREETRTSGMKDVVIPGLRHGGLTPSQKRRWVAEYAAWANRWATKHLGLPAIYDEAGIVRLPSVRRIPMRAEPKEERPLTKEELKAMSKADRHRYQSKIRMRRMRENRNQEKEQDGVALLAAAAQHVPLPIPPSRQVGVKHKHRVRWLDQIAMAEGPTATGDDVVVVMPPLELPMPPPPPTPVEVPPPPVAPSPVNWATISAPSAAPHPLLPLADAFVHLSQDNSLMGPPGYWSQDGMGSATGGAGSSARAMPWTSASPANFANVFGLFGGT